MIPLLSTWPGYFWSDCHSQGSVLAARLPSECQYITGWVTRTISLGEEIQALDYHEGQDSYVIGTSHKGDFKQPDNEVLYDFGSEGEKPTN